MVWSGFTRFFNTRNGIYAELRDFDANAENSSNILSVDRLGFIPKKASLLVKRHSGTTTVIDVRLIGEPVSTVGGDLLLRVQEAQFTYGTAVVKDIPAGYENYSVVATVVGSGNNLRVYVGLFE